MFILFSHCSASKKGSEALLRISLTSMLIYASMFLCGKYYDFPYQNLTKPKTILYNIGSYLTYNWFYLQCQLWGILTYGNSMVWNITKKREDTSWKYWPNKGIKFEVHDFDSGAAMIDIWIGAKFYVIQLEPESIGMSVIDKENLGFDTIPDSRYFSFEDFQRDFLELLSTSSWMYGIKEYLC